MDIVALISSIRVIVYIVISSIVNILTVFEYHASVTYAAYLYVS